MGLCQTTSISGTYTIPNNPLRPPTLAAYKPITYICDNPSDSDSASLFSDDGFSGGPGRLNGGGGLNGGSRNNVNGSVDPSILIAGGSYGYKNSGRCGFTAFRCDDSGKPYRG